MKKTVSVILITTAVIVITITNDHYYDDYKYEDVPDALKGCKNLKNRYWVEKYRKNFTNTNIQYTGSLLRQKEILEEILACSSDEQASI